MEKNVLLSYPRSGNHWVRFIIEWFSGKPTKGLSPNDPPIKNSILNKEILSHVKGDFIIHKEHGVPKGNINKLILILRNPKECIYRQTKNLAINQIDSYMKLVNFYENYGGKKFLLYYEDLITNPKNSVKKIIDFMDIYDENKFNDFMENYDLFFGESIKIYDNTNKMKIVSGNKFRTSETKGKSIIYHVKKINQDKIKIFNEHINKKHSNLKKYINRYE
jgi:hypothetical protein